MERIQHGLISATLDARLTPSERELLRTLDMLDHATKYLAAQFNVDMSLRDAKSNLDAGNLPQSIAAEERSDDDRAWDMMMERDRYNMLYGKGAYAPAEPEPDEVAYEEPRMEDQEFTGQGLEMTIPGLE